MKAQLMLVAALALAIALIAALLAYTIVTSVRVEAPKYRTGDVVRVLKELCTVSWSALSYASSAGNATLASRVTSNFAKLVNSLGAVSLSLNTLCDLNWCVNPAYSNITLLINVSNAYVSIKNISIYSALIVRSSYRVVGGKYYLDLTVKLCRCNYCYPVPIVPQNTNLTSITSYYEYLGSGTTRFILSSSVSAVEVVYDGIKVVVKVS